MFQQMIRQVYNADTYSLTGKIENIVGMSIEASGGKAAVGDICRIYNGESGVSSAPPDALTGRWRPGPAA